MIWDTSIWRLGCSNHSKIRSAQKCYPCLRYVVSPMSPGRTLKKVEPRVGVEPTTCRFLHRYHVVGFTRFIPHHTLWFCMVFGWFCSEVVHNFFGWAKRLGLLLNKLQVQGDSHAIDEDDALIQKLLVRDFGVHELLDGGARTNEFDGFGSPFGAGREFVEDGKVEELEFHVWGNPVG